MAKKSTKKQAEEAAALEAGAGAADAETATATADTDTAPAGDGPGRRSRKTRIGVVSSDKADKTVTVTVERTMAHPLYGKRVSRRKKYHAHDEKNEYKVGDKVRIAETRPLSKTKRWRVVELIERSSG